MKQKINSTDLHVKFKIEEDGDYQWPNGIHYSGNYHSTLGYSREYALWIEEQYLELLNKNQRNLELEEENDRLEYELANAYHLIDELEYELNSLYEKYPEN